MGRRGSGCRQEKGGAGRGGEQINKLCSKFGESQLPSGCDSQWRSEWMREARGGNGLWEPTGPRELSKYE